MAHGGVKIEVNLDKSKLQGSMRGLEGDIIKGMSAFEILRQGATKVLDMVATSLDAAMKRIDTMDQFSRVMTTITGSAEKANAALAKTTDIVTGTAFGLDIASKGVQAFVASGMQVSKATDTMAAWADATAFYTKGTNAELETVSTALQKMQTKGTVTMEHLQMLLEAGVPAIQIYAAATKQSTDEVTAQMGRSEIKTDDFIAKMNEAFQTGVTGFPSIAGAAKSAGTSWQGSMDNMRAAIARGTSAMLEQLDASLNVKNGMVNFGKTLENVLKTLANNLDVIIPLAVGALGAILAFKAISAIPALISAVKGAFEALSAAFVANPIILTIAAVIAGVVALMAVTDALSNRVDGYQKAFAESVEAAESQSQANQQLIESMNALDDEYKRAEAQAITTAEANRGLVDRLVELQGVLRGGAASAGETAAAEREMAQITNDLNSSVAGLGLEVDAATGSFNMNEDAIRAAIDAQEAYNKAISKLEYARQKIDALSDVEAELYLTEQALVDQKGNLNDALDGETTALGVLGQQIDKGIVGVWDWIKGTKGVIDATDDLTGEEAELNKILERSIQYWEDEAAEALRVAQAQNGVGQSVDDLAGQYRVSISEIRSWMDSHQQGLQDWEEYHKTTLNEAGENINQVAEKWGVSVAEIKTAMADNNLDLQGWEDEQTRLYEEWLQTATENIDGVVNGFKEIPEEAELSLEEMATLLETNNARMAAWKQNLVTLSSTLGPEMMSVIESWGPEYNSLLEEYLADPNGEMGQKFYTEMLEATGQGAAGAQSTASQYQAAGSDNIQAYSDALQSNTAPNEAAQIIADGVAGELSRADYSAITT